MNDFCVMAFFLNTKSPLVFQHAEGKRAIFIWVVLSKCRCYAVGGLEGQIVF